MVGAPAIGLIVTGIIGILFQVANILLNLLGMGMSGVAAASGDSGAVGGLMSGVLGLVYNGFACLMGGLVIFGALRMKALKGYGVALTGAIIAALPCTSPCCFLGLPLGIWAIVVLMNQDVKTSFS